jgi:hypothetical protein
MCCDVATERITETSHSRVSFASTVLLNPVGSLRLSRAQKPNRYARAAPPDVSLPAIAARPLVNPASGTVRLGSMSESGQTEKNSM